MRKYGKKYVEASKNIDKSKFYDVKEAIKLAKESSVTSFDSSIEVAIKLNVDPKKADQQLRGSLVLPNGTGKTRKVLVIAKGDAAQAAKDAGADYVGDADMIEKIEITQDIESTEVGELIAQQLEEQNNGENDVFASFKL